MPVLMQLAIVIVIGQARHQVTITGVPTGIISYCVYPAAPYNDPNRWPNIICAYQCAGGNQGGCNTPAQVVAYFMNVFGGTFRSHTT